ncbi:GH39 family glycosyl hydrolase [Evansella cellulosilytica]|uniref:Xylan 1,4-beta-xylosidase n=1 Tax=Evansella cellulosilytica (strain ATCC 21833 / DSM 2522 / FERM P-1141 / JCM 9156 / N-4) TaxID=649639 RepID=E6TXK6_EVAC2|nr:xylan 1,4-beta-xylosidase [Evansella cellulosilytica]ADU28820.1 Xylan 1,4-beta-xylosidase [Evansella cellulosilytica DSM 2522]
MKIINDKDNQYFSNNWNYCIGTGRLGLALQKEYWDHLKLVQEKISFQFIRGHGLLHDDIGIYRELNLPDGSTKPFYNFTYINRIFDSYLQLGLRPFIEFGFMPQALASGDQTIFAWEGNVTPPNDYDKWYNLIHAVVSHFIDRYGLEEVKKWPFEVWNEPNLVNFWKDANKEEYFKLYKITASAVKDVCPDLKVGGPAICGGSDEWITDFLTFCKNENVPVDFVSRHAYTSAKPHKVTPEYYYQELFDCDHMLDELKEVRELIHSSPFPHLPFHITEYNTSYSPINPVHDTPLNAAYLARVLSEAGDYVDSFSYWTFSDVFEEADVPKAQFHGGFGLVALNGIPKPTYHLFSFFNKLGEIILHRDTECIVTKRGDDSITIVVWNVVMKKGHDFNKDMSIDLPFPYKEAFIKRQTIDENHANPWKVWKQMGRPRFPKQNEIETLIEVAKPQIRTERKLVIDGRLPLTITLTKNEVSFIEISRVKDETETYIELDDSLIPSYSKEWSS